MRYKDLIKHFGSVANAAKALRMTRQGVYRWRSSEIPYDSQCMIELATSGALKATQPDGLKSYERLKRQWQDEHPEASPTEYHTAMTAIARRCGV